MIEAQKEIYNIDSERAVRRFYVDIHRLANKNKKSKTNESFHTYTVDGVCFSKARTITEIPAGEGDELYVDTIPIELTDEFIDVLRRDVKIFYLRRIGILARRRKDTGLSKTNRNDIKAMMGIESGLFIEIDVDFLVIRRLSAAFRSLLRTHSSLLNRAKALQGTERRILMRLVKTTEKAINVMARLIVTEAERRMPAYRKVVEDLRISGDNHLLTREALVEVLLYVNRSISYKQLRKFIGLFPGRKGVDKFYNKPARSALSRLTAAVLNNAHHRAKDEYKLLRRIWTIVKNRNSGEDWGHRDRQRRKTLGGRCPD
ncbi:MAG: hypothetical protein QXM16_07800 [Nitrososphaerota archaeon]